MEETYRKLISTLARRGALRRSESQELCRVAFEIGRADRIETDLVTARRAILADAHHQVALAAAEGERRDKALHAALERQTAARNDAESSLWEISKQRTRIRAELRDARQALKASQTAKVNAQQDARSAIRRVEQLTNELAELRASAEGLREVARQADRRLEEATGERDHLAAALAECRDQIRQANQLRDELQLRAMRREEHLSRRKSSVKRTIRHVRGQKAVLSRQVQQLECENARLVAGKKAMERQIELLRDTDRRMDETLERSRKIFANVSAVLSEAGAQFVRNALAAEFHRVEGAPPAAFSTTSSAIAAEMTGRK